MNPGKHKARAIDVGLGFTNEGKPQIGVLFEVTEGEDEGDYITWFGYFTEKTSERTVQSLRYCGWQGDDLSTLTPEDMPTEVQIVVDEEEDQNGNLRLKVQWVNKLGGGVALKNRMNDSAKAEFAQRMRGLCMSVTPDKKNGNGGQPPARQQARPPLAAVPTQRQPGEDEIPF